MANDMISAVDVRKSIVSRLEQDLVGPLLIDEVLEAEKIRPSDVYLSGILWPIGDLLGPEDDDGSSGDDEEDESPSTATITGMQKPCTMGISFATSSAIDLFIVDVEIYFAIYKHFLFKSEAERKINRWERKPFIFHLQVDLKNHAGKTFKLEHADLDASVEVAVRTVTTSSGTLSTITLINRSTNSEGDRNSNEELSLFQTSIVIRPRESTLIIPRPLSQISIDSDEKSNRLLYRNVYEFAAGHQCSVSWNAIGNNASSISTTWLPNAQVPAYKEDGDVVFRELVESGYLDAEKLAELSDDELIFGLNKLADSYTTWIDRQNLDLNNLEGELLETAKAHITRCNEVCNRIRDGVNAFGKNPILLESFKLANAAMSLQHSWKKNSFGAPLPLLRWRPFQLGFILLAAQSTCDLNAPNRDVLDLLWFPTGGGKTEAYLALIAMLAWYRRLSNTDPDDGAGNAAVMRYTLRLLTAQQFERAASMILACELIRKGLAAPRKHRPQLGRIPFSIGLWVGKDATPNNFASALQLSGTRGGSSAEQIDNCPYCGSRVSWTYDEQNEEVRAICETADCVLGSAFGRWPIYTVDQDIYLHSPTLLIGTVDKFAQLPFRNDLATLFGFRGPRSTDLIIQDELHLISGPLGTLTGLYETAFDWLLEKDGIKPKIIGSTATIRRAEEQVRALFDRSSCQFPPPGITYENSGFAVVDYDKPWRQYVGVTTAGRSAKFALQAVASSLLQSGGPSTVFSDNDRDGYATLLCYFNSLRELGGAIVQMLDDVPDSIKLYSQRRNENPRIINLPQELTSRVSQKEIIEILSELKRPPSSKDCIDVVLATNMVSVGVDVPRLGLMLVNGQPKTRSEYIQSTSRVGRSSFPGLVVSLLNSAKARDRSHYETFPTWHSIIYKDVEATSVTPFASRARDRALKAVLVSMIRHGSEKMHNSPDLSNASDDFLNQIVSAIEKRVKSVDSREFDSLSEELNELLSDWDALAPSQYLMNRYKPKERSLIQYADDHAKRIASGRAPGLSWPLMNTMRSVEPSSRFRIAERLSSFRPGINLNDQSPASDGNAVAEVAKDVPRWRKGNA
jgi:hypothetical protein